MSTYVRILSRLVSSTPVGSAWTFVVDALNEDGYLTGDVVPVFTVTRPDTSTTVPVPVVPTLGMYAFSYTLTMVGRHTVHISTPDDALDLAVYALGPTTAAGMPTTSDCVTYMGNYAGTYDTATITDALNAELAAQRSKCGERNPYPDDLRQALLRRVQRNLAMRKLPLAVNFGDAETGTTFLPGNDPEVRRFEAPWRKKVMG